ncbi:MAG: hypothetical protein A2145_00875 [candidate division Zixibacteria bacterium RBG_16_40_9]|nr:MAG: hypothetical protein A2145_00875 [candidate division Zixibacteria bacterium RBG_16_40_9]
MLGSSLKDNIKNQGINNVKINTIVEILTKLSYGALNECIFKLTGLAQNPQMISHIHFFKLF